MRKHARLLLLPPPPPSPLIHEQQAFNCPLCARRRQFACHMNARKHSHRHVIPFAVCGFSEKLCLVAEAEAKQRASLRWHRMFRFQSEIAFQWNQIAGEFSPRVSFTFLCWFSLTNHWRCVSVWCNFYISNLQWKVKICGRQEGINLCEIVFWKNRKSDSVLVFTSVWRIQLASLASFSIQWHKVETNTCKILGRYSEGESTHSHFSTLIFYVWSNETNRIKKHKKYKEKDHFQFDGGAFSQRYVRAWKIPIWTVGKRRHNARGH